MEKFYTNLVKEFNLKGVKDSKQFVEAIRDEEFETDEEEKDHKSPITMRNDA